MASGVAWSVEGLGTLFQLRPFDLNLVEFGTLTRTCGGEVPVRAVPCARRSHLWAEAVNLGLLRD